MHQQSGRISKYGFYNTVFLKALSYVNRRVCVFIAEILELNGADALIGKGLNLDVLEKIMILSDFTIKL
jgi:hypothetical protein